VLSSDREVFPNAERIALTNVPASSEIVPLQSMLFDGGFIHRCIDYPLATRGISQLVAVRRKLRETGADTLIYLQRRFWLPHVYRDVLFFRACGFRRIIGAPTTADMNFNRVDPATGEAEPEAERLPRCIAALGTVDLDDPAAWDLRPTSAEGRRADEMLAPLRGHPFIAASVGGKLSIQDWGDANWHALLGQVAPKTDIPLVFVGGADDSARSMRLAQNWRAPVLDACGRLSPRETAALLRRGALFVGHDSGPMHLAAASGLRCVSLFGTRQPPRIWHPYGRQHRTFHDMGDVKNIPLAPVAAAIMEVLAERVATP